MRAGDLRLPLFWLFCLFLSVCFSMPVSGVAAPDLTGQVYQATGSLHVDGDPTGMEISLDGRVAGQVDVSGVLVIDSIAVGEHTLTATYPGYAPREMLVEVPEGLPAEVRVNLEKEMNGVVDIDSTPPNVQIYVDDLYKGVTPAQVEASVGSHVVLLRLPGYQDWTSPVQVTADQPVKVSGVLQAAGTSPVETPQGGPETLVTLAISVLCCVIAALGNRRSD